jgi:two-component system sensor histidine kinase ChvG
VSLRLKLFGVSLLTLVLPWAGCTYVQEMEAALKLGFEQSLQGSAQTIATALDGRTELLYGQRQGLRQIEMAAAILAHRLPGEPGLDGYRDDWGLATAAAIVLAPNPRTDFGAAKYWAGVRGRYLYIYVEVEDPLVEYSTPTKPGDRVILVDGQGRRLAFATAAPGPLGANVMLGDALTNNREQRVAGFWRETASGYALEIQMPLAVVGNTLSIHVVDANARGPTQRTGSSSSYTETGSLIYPRLALADTLRAFTQTGLRIRVVDTHGWLLASQGALARTDADQPAAGGLLSTLYGWLLKQEEQPYADVVTGWLATSPVQTALTGRPNAAWFADPIIAESIVQVSRPLMVGDRIMGAIVLEQSSGSMLTLTNRALTRLMNFTLLATLIAALGSVGYATVLSLRVGRLAQAAEEALGPDGELNPRVPGIRAGDELGALARSFARLLGRLGDYNDYLRGLASKLSHELRTPLAVITSSLENLEQEEDPAQQQLYRQRLHSGAQRLDRLVSAMSEATRIEQAVKEAERVRFRPAAVIESTVRGYADAYPQRRFNVNCDDQGLSVSGSPDLLTQLLDKLVDNALSFAPPDGVIEVNLSVDDDDLMLQVANPGPLLPESMTGRLFDSLVSIRDKSGDKPHLGLGLFIVRLIAEYHGGSVAANNLADSSGVVFQVQLPTQS